VGLWPLAHWGAIAPCHLKYTLALPPAVPGRCSSKFTYWTQFWKKYRWQSSAPPYLHHWSSDVATSVCWRETAPFVPIGMLMIVMVDVQKVHINRDYNDLHLLVLSQPTPTAHSYFSLDLCETQWSNCGTVGGQLSFFCPLWGCWYLYFQLLEY